MSPFIEQLGWVLIHSLWQLALLAAAAFVTQRAMRRTSAAARYAALLAILVLVVAAPLITWSVLPTQAAIPVADLPDPVPVRASEPAPQLKPVAPALAPAPVTVESTPPITAVTPVPPEPVVPAKAPEPLKPSWSQWAQQSITPWLSTIVWGWSLGVLAFAIRPLWSWFTVRQLRTQGVSPVSESVQAALAETARRLGMTQAVRVLQSTIVQVPIVAGYLKPVILLPASIVMGLPASQLEAILAHELAHIRRHDYLANLIQTLVETVFFYHPAVWWLSHQIRCERENCCDDIAVAMLGNRLDYSRALLAVEELRGTPTTLAVGASGGSLLGRVRRLFHRDVDQLRLSNGSITLCGLIGIGLIALATVASTNHDGSGALFTPGAKAEIDGFGTIEVLGLRFVDSEWWSPDGSNLSANVDLGDPIASLFNDDPANGRQIGIVTRFSGVDSPRASRVHLHTSRAAGHHGSWSSMDRRTAEQSRITDIRFCSTNLSPEATSGDLKVLLSFDAWSPWYTIDLKSPEASQNQGPLALLVGRTPSSLESTQCDIGLQFKSGVHEEIHFEQVALDAAGNEIPSRGSVGNKHLGLKHYAVPESQVAKLRYRFQRFTHEVRFRDISLKAGRQTEPQTRVLVLHRPVRPAAFSEPVTSLASWPQLGGSAAHNPISPVTNLPTQFDLDRQENIRWSQPIGDFAFSSPVVSGGKVLIGTNNAIGRDLRFPASIDRACLQCFDERTGEFLWQYSSPKMEQGRRHDWPSIGICSTPVIEGDRVWFATNRCEIVCLDLNGHRDNEDDGEPEASASGEAAKTLAPNPSPGGRGEQELQRADVVWKYDMFNTLGVRPLNATCVTPVIAGDLLLLNSGNDVDESYVNIPAPEAPAFLAFHKSTGQLIWSDKTPKSEHSGQWLFDGSPRCREDRRRLAGDLRRV
jgi:beta-lactamase regulating signal transducer with metallopeptidase domain